MSTFTLAWRNIWRNKRRTAVTIAAIVVALVITLNYSALVAGMLTKMKSDALDVETGAVQIHAPGYLDKPSLYTNMKNSDAILADLHKHGIVATSRLLGMGLVASGESSSGAMIFGVDLKSDAQVLSISQKVQQGQWLSASNAHGVVIGRKLAHTLGIKVGSELIVLGQASDGSMANELYHVQGILSTVGEATDRGGVFMSQATFRELLSYQGGAHRIIVKRPAILDTKALKGQVQKFAAGQDVKSWSDLNPILATMMQSVSGMIGIFFFIINIAIGIVILNAMLMAVFERIKEFGVLKALGVGPWGVLKLIYAESLLQLVISVVIGLLMALPILWYLVVFGINMGSMAGTDMMGMTMMDIWYAELSPQVFSQPIMMTIFVVIFAVLYPAYKAAVIQPVDAMRHQ